MPNSFGVTWDYLCPFARNAHEHLVTGAQGRGGLGRPVQVFLALAQAHVPRAAPLFGTSRRLTLECWPGWLASWCESGNRSASSTLIWPFSEPGMTRGSIFVTANSWPKLSMRLVSTGPGSSRKPGTGGRPSWRKSEHDEALQRWEVFGVPTFIANDRAVFVRLMSRPEGDGKLAESTVERVIDILDGFPDLNEYKFTQIPR